MVAKLEAALASIPEGLRSPLIQLYHEALSEYRAGRWEAVGVKVGKLCEVVFSIIDGKVSGVYLNKPSKPNNVVDACNKLAQHNKLHGRSLCIQIPKVLIAAYEIRNNRDIGHVGSDVNPNRMDAEFLLRSAKWMVAELIRQFANLTVEDAQTVVEAVTERSHSLVWEHKDFKRVLNPSLKTKDKILVLTYVAGGTAAVSNLTKWSDYSSAARLRADVLRDLHTKAFIHFDRSADEVHLLPPGLVRVERELLH